MNLEGKRILFLSAYFFGYNEQICKAMQAKGAIVDYFDERPANSVFVKAIIRLRPELLKSYIQQYHNNIIEKTKNNKYDYIVIIKAESITVENLKMLKQTHSDAKLILYLWDSVKNFKNAEAKLPLFDKVLSFDRYDCDELGLIFRPLFYSKDYADIAVKQSSQDIDVLFIGTMHSDRYRFVKNIENSVTNSGKKVYYYLFFMSNVLYYKMKFSNKALRGTKKSDFYFKSISQNDVVELFAKTKNVVDIQHPQQTGLTMRTIETLGAKRKLITTNKDIVNYDFYNQSNILIVDRAYPKIDDAFLSSPYQEIDNDVYQYYSIDSWINNILD